MPLINTIILIWASTAQKMIFSIKDFFRKCDQLLKTSLMENFIFCAKFFYLKHFL